MIMARYKNIVWDWNGTLLDDVAVGVDTLNEMLGRRALRLLSVEEYKDRFGFPVVEFYQKIGFRELECMDGLWDEANPCQVYVMAVK